MTGRYDYGEGWSTDEEEEGHVFRTAGCVSRQDGSHCGLCGEEVRDGVRPDGCMHRFCWQCIHKRASEGSVGCPTCHRNTRGRTRVVDQAPWQEGPPAVPVDRDRWHARSADVAPEADTWRAAESNECYIAEDKVMCLPGASCRVRAGSTWNQAEGGGVDLSVACDSCNKWFHASCVAFDHSHSPHTWICPPCKVTSHPSHPPSLRHSYDSQPPAVDCYPNVTSRERREEGRSVNDADVVSPRREALVRIAAKVVAEMLQAEKASSPPPLLGGRDGKPALSRSEGEETECPLRDGDARRGGGEAETLGAQDKRSEEEEGGAGGEEEKPAGSVEGERGEVVKDEERGGGEVAGVCLQEEEKEEEEVEVEGGGEEDPDWFGAGEEGGNAPLVLVEGGVGEEGGSIVEIVAEKSREEGGAGGGMGAEGGGVDVEDTFMVAYKATANISKVRREAEAPKWFGKSQEAVATRRVETDMRERIGKRMKIEGRRVVGREGSKRVGVDGPHSIDIRARAAALLAKKEEERHVDKRVGGRKEESLWACLPDEMKPTLKLNLRSRIPTAIRQTYLSRWVSLHLLLARPPVIGSNEETERAVASAVRVEAEVFAGAGSKAAYETVSRRSLAAAAAEKSIAGGGTEEVAAGSGEEGGVGGMGVDGALLATGLVSDSPPPTPPSQLRDVDDRIQMLRPIIMERVRAEGGVVEEWEEWAEDNRMRLPGGGGEEGPIWSQVEVFVKEHLHPLVASGVIGMEQREWAAKRTVKKVMQHHGSATSAEFLIGEGMRVRRLAEQYVESWREGKRKDGKDGGAELKADTCVQL